MDVEAVCERQRGAMFEVRHYVLLVERCLFLVRRQHHRDIGVTYGVANSHHGQPGLLCLGPRGRALAQTDDHVYVTVPQIQSMGVAL